jgi:Rv2175c C-terminal domain of unknown function
VPDETDAPENAVLEDLVGDWLPIPDLAEQLGIPLRETRRLVNDRVVLAHRVGERNVIAVPAKFVQDGAVLASVPGTITVLDDAGLSDEEALTWLFTPDETLPIDGAPIDMLQAGRKAEVRKRAQELAF